mmetsp:Transcript_27984/g.45060  ORF Transcript_27984/g.45060 Transcript_27984/m.45060 type:complete len:118 (+) Transcript_27984:2-355(+)
MSPSGSRHTVPKCKVCNQTFSETANYMRHLRTWKHRIRWKTSFNASEEDTISTFGPRSPPARRSTEEIASEQLWSCETCDKKYRKKSTVSIKQHLKLHPQNATIAVPCLDSIAFART